MKDVKPRLGRTSKLEPVESLGNVWDSELKGAGAAADDEEQTWPGRAGGLWLGRLCKDGSGSGG